MEGELELPSTGTQGGELELPTAQPSVLERIGAGLGNIPSSIASGLAHLGSAALTSPDPNQAFLDRLLNVGRGALSGATAGMYSPEAPTTEAQQAQQTLGQAAGSLLPFAGLIKALGLAGVGARAATPIAGALMGGAAPLAQGQPGEALQQALTGAGGAGLMQEIPALAQRTGKFMASPGAIPVREAEATQASNIAANAADRAAYEQALQLHLRQQQALEAFKLQQEQARQLSQAAAAERLTRISDKEQAVLEATRRAAPATATEQAYDFLNQGMPMPPVAVPKLAQALEGVRAELETTPRAFQPTGVVKAERGTASAIDETTGGRVVGPQGQDLSNLSQVQQSIWAPVLEQMGQMSQGGTIQLNTLRKVQQGLGRLTRDTDPRVSGVAKNLYGQMMEDLEEASKTTPEAGQLLAATKIAKQNLGAEDLADFMTNHGTRRKNGQILLQADKLDQKLQDTKNPIGIARSLRPEALADIKATLEEVFKVKTAPRLRPKDIIDAPAPKVGPAPEPRTRLPEGFEPQEPKLNAFARHPWLTASGLHYMGIPVPAAALAGAAIAYPRAIFRAAITPTGRKFIRTLYAQVPPLVNDMARYSAVVNFLRSQGETDVEPTPELVQWQQQQAQAQAQAQQQQQQMQLQQLLMQQQQGGQR